MNPILITASLFSMSLIAAFVLFKVLKNTAAVKLPFGQFGGAVAGFIGVFLMLDQSYSRLSNKSVPSELQVPPGYKAFVSPSAGFGIGYPKELVFKESDDLKIVGTILLPKKLGVVVVGYEDLPGTIRDMYQTDAELAQGMLEANRNGITEMSKFSIQSRTNLWISGVKGEQYEMVGTVAGDKLKCYQAVFPDVRKLRISVFNLTVFSEKDEAESKQMFESMLSTVKFF